VGSRSDARTGADEAGWLERTDFDVSAWGCEVWSPLEPTRVVNVSDLFEQKARGFAEHRSQLAHADMVHCIRCLDAHRGQCLPAGRTLPGSVSRSPTSRRERQAEPAFRARGGSCPRRPSSTGRQAPTPGADEEKRHPAPRCIHEANDPVTDPGQAAASAPL
jgi:hypothetical protein